MRYRASLSAIVVGACALAYALPSMSSEPAFQPLSSTGRDLTIPFCDWDNHPVNAVCYQDMHPGDPYIPPGTPCIYDSQGRPNQRSTNPLDLEVWFDVNTSPAYPPVLSYVDGSVNYGGVASCAMTTYDPTIPWGTYRLRAGVAFTKPRESEVLDLSGYFSGFGVEGRPLHASVDYRLDRAAQGRELVLALQIQNADNQWFDYRTMYSGAVSEGALTIDVALPPNTAFRVQLRTALLEGYMNFTVKDIHVFVPECVLDESTGLCM